MAIGNTGKLTVDAANQQFAQDALYMRSVYDWMKRKRVEYQQNAAALAVLFPNSSDQFLYNTMSDNMARLISSFENQRPADATDILGNLAQISGLG